MLLKPSVEYKNAGCCPLCGIGMVCHKQLTHLSRTDLFADFHSPVHGRIKLAARWPLWLDLNVSVELFGLDCAPGLRALVEGEIYSGFAVRNVLYISLTCFSSLAVP